MGPSGFENVLKSRQVEHCEDLEHFNGVSLLQTKAGGSVGSCHALSVKSEADALMENSNVITSIKLYAIQSHYLGVESVSLAVGGHQLLQSSRSLDLELRGVPTSVLHLKIQYLSMLDVSFVIVNIRIHFSLMEKGLSLRFSTMRILEIFAEISRGLRSLPSFQLPSD